MSSVPGDDSLRLFEAEDRDAVRQYLDTYFDKSDIADCVFLHRATTIAEWNQGQLDKTLLKAICASGLRHTSSYHGERSMAYAWMKQVQNELLGQMGGMSVPKLQALMLVVKFLSSLRFTGDVWVLISIAARVAFTKRLNYERPAMDPVKQDPPPGSLRLQEKLHRRSKHAYAPDDEEEVDPAVNPPESNQDEALPTEETPSVTPIDSLTQGNWSFSAPSDSQDMFVSNQGGSAQPLGYGLMNYDLSNSADVVFGEHDMVFPMDPFDLQLNAYTDANVPHYIGSE
ncbi:hypothetical protein ACHAPT_012846 [Fusarium lateritium]